LFRLEAERMGNRVMAEIRADSEPAAPPPAGQWPPLHGDPLRPSGPTVLKFTIRVTIDPIGMQPLQMENQVWFDPVSGTPLRLIRSRRGTDDYQQWFVFGRKGVFRRQIEPANPVQAAGPLEGWTRVSENVYVNPADAAPCPAIVETSMLIYFMSSSAAKGALNLDSACVFHKRQLHAVRFRTEHRERFAFDYLERRAGENQRRAGSTGAVTIRLSSTAIGDFRGKVEPFFKDAEFTVSADGRLPLAGACEFPVVGRVDLRLKEIHFD
jgi:hypothetical protein